MFGFGMGVQEQWILQPDGRVLHRVAIADALGNPRQGSASLSWSEDLVDWDQVPSAVQRKLAAARKTLGHAASGSEEGSIGAGPS